MEPSTMLRRTVAEFFEVDEGQVGPTFSLQSRRGSIARAALDAAIRGRIGRTSLAIYSAKTFGELESDLLNGTSSSPPLPAPVEAAIPAESMTTSPGVSCGVDLELVASLPEAEDYWEDDFYKTHFAPPEIAYCLRQSDPNTHFAARWCAKEALKKCDRAFLAVPFRDLEVVSDETGAPHLEYNDGSGSRRLPHALSLSHTAHAAVAMVVRIAGSEVPVAAPMPVSSPAVALPSQPAPHRSSRWLLALNLVAIILAGLALARTFPHFRWPFSG